MKTSTVETLVWALVYGGLLLAAIGVFVLRAGAPGLGWTMIALGGAAAAGGAVLGVVRARMKKPEPDREPLK